jgi:citrate synthase
MDCIAKLPRVASLIYRNTYHGGKIIAPKKELDWSANFAHMLGFQDPAFDEVMRMYVKFMFRCALISTVLTPSACI